MIHTLEADNTCSQPAVRSALMTRISCIPINLSQVKELLLEEKNNKGFLITDHLYQHIIDISDKFYILLDGRTHLAKNITDVERLGYARI